MKHCALCGYDFEPQDLNRFSGLDLCDPCCRRDPEYHLVRLGIAHRHRIWQQVVRSRKRSRVKYHLDLEIELGEVDTGIALHCEREHMLMAFKRLFERELQVGDPIFDDMIFVETRSRAAVGELLSSEGLQSAIMGLVGISGDFHLEGATIRSSRSRRDPFSSEQVQEFLLEGAAAAIHVRRWALEDARP